MDALSYEFMQRALLAAVLVGAVAPTVGVHLLQRRLALIGDGLGHVALAGVAIGVVTGSAPVGTALVVAVAGAVVVELIRLRARAGGDVALALLFYGGIALGVVLLSRAPEGRAVNLDAYLFGSVTTTTVGDVVTFAVLSAVVLAVTVGFGRYLLAAGVDEAYARAAGLPVVASNLALAVITAVTVVVSMRVVGLLLISALMVVPVVAAQQVVSGFWRTTAVASGIGVAASLLGVVGSYQADTPSGGTIVLLTIAAFLVALVARGLLDALAARRARRSPA
ncbi:MAG: metal ABC transporter permease [Verrucomicrobiae bacterium]|nr:metal ABC transporter permease [Acidimicrobiales bacterium]MCB1130268.1 metal ABC transporter permease [Verrucomicrobiae bacterium]